MRLKKTRRNSLCVNPFWGFFCITLIDVALQTLWVCFVVHLVTTQIVVDQSIHSRCLFFVVVCVCVVRWVRTASLPIIIRMRRTMLLCLMISIRCSTDRSSNNTMWRREIPTPITTNFVIFPVHTAVRMTCLNTMKVPCSMTMILWVFLVRSTVNNIITTMTIRMSSMICRCSHRMGTPYLRLSLPNWFDERSMMRSHQIHRHPRHHPSKWSTKVIIVQRMKRSLNMWWRNLQRSPSYDSPVSSSSLPLCLWFV